ncbi:MAG: AlbA family DNA-binding domain-containing protein [Gammaproteobacteria bacterium]
MRLITAPIASLTWQDVLDFCGLDLPEGATIDYKRDIPTKLGQTVAAMANTDGGIVLIGIDEDRTTTRPVLPPLGLPSIRGVPERITNLCISNITPPLVPEMAVVPDSSDTKVVAVIRVPQSHQAPHAVARNTKVYLRRGSVNSPEDLATIDELEWLKSGRQRSLEFREALYRRAQARFVQFLRGYDGSNAKPPRVERDGMLSLAFCPAYPKDMLVDPPGVSAQS